MRDIRNLFEHEQEENYQKKVQADSLWSNNSTECGRNGERNKSLSLSKNTLMNKLY